MTVYFNILDAALSYAERGWRVFPCRVRGKEPATSDGFKSATTHRPTIIGWWSSNPNYNIGIATGPGSNLFVLDVDEKPGKASGTATIKAMNVTVPATLTVRTGSGGWQYYFRFPEGSGVTISAGKIGPGIDTRGDGGYVVAPESVHPDTGEKYVWQNDPGGDLADVPPWVLEKLSTAEKPKRAEPVPVVIGENRNSTLMSLAGSMRARGMTRDEIEVAISAVNDSRCSPALPTREIQQIAKHVSVYAPKRPAEAYALTDLGNAERFVAASMADLRYCKERKGWYSWTGQKWDDEGDGFAHARAHDVVRSVRGEAAAGQDADQRKALWAWANKSESSERLRAMVAVAKDRRDIRCSVTDFDADPWALNCENGTLNLRTGQIEPHDPARMCSRLAPVRFVPGARHPTLDAYLDLVTESDPELIAFIQRCLGYSLTGNVGAEVLFLVLGPGGSGKTTLVEALKKMLGDYGGTVAAKTLLAKRASDGHTSDVARMHGRRMIGASEFEKGARLDAALVKGLTGGESIVARNIYEADFEFQPMAKFWLAANDPPVIDDNDTGMWRRVLRIPFDRVIPAEKRSDTAKQEMASDPGVRSALLAWALQGCLEWQARGGGINGLAAPAKVLNATAAYREESNPLADFVAELCETAPEYTCPLADMKRAYKSWCIAERAQPMKLQEFKDRLAKLGIGEDRSAEQRFFRGVRVAGGPVLSKLTNLGVF